MDTKLIELLAKNTSLLADWQYREIVVEKINEIINFINNSDKKNSDEIIKKFQEEEAKKVEQKRIDEEEKKLKEEEDNSPKIPNPTDANNTPDVDLKN